MRRTSENPDGLGTANIDGVRVALGAEEVGDPVDRGHERQDVQAGPARDQGPDVVVVGSPHCHEPSGGRVLLGGLGAVGVGLLDGGVQDCLEPGPPQRGDHTVHHLIDLSDLWGRQPARVAAATRRAFQRRPDPSPAASRATHPHPDPVSQPTPTRLDLVSRRRQAFSTCRSAQPRATWRSSTSASRRARRFASAATSTPTRSSRQPSNIPTNLDEPADSFPSLPGTLSYPNAMLDDPRTDGAARVSGRAGSAQAGEEFGDVIRQQLWLFGRREVSASPVDVPAADCVEPLKPGSRRFPSETNSFGNSAMAVGTRTRSSGPSGVPCHRLS